MRIASLVTLVILFPVFAHAAVVINEVAWMGTAVTPNGSYCEWIELTNTGSESVNLNGWTLSVGATTKIFNEASGATLFIAPHSFYLIERLTPSACPDPVPGIPADWSVSFGNGISDNGTKLILSDATVPIDTVDMSSGWTAGNKDTKETAQRTTNNTWITATPTPRAINVGVSSDTSDSGDTATTTPASSGSSGSSTYTPPSSSIVVKISGARKAFMEVPMTLSARVTSKSGVVDSSAQISWSFGDGSSALGNEVTKTYHYAGMYVVTATANNGIAKARDEIIVSVVPSQVHILSVSSEGIMITNDSDERLDLSQWRLSSSMGSFRIPEGTTILSEASVLFPSAITNLPVAFDATLSYPDGIVAARFVPTIVTPQPSVEPVSSNQVQTVEDIISTKTLVESYENKAVIAPTATPDTGVAVGAALSAPTAPPTLAAAATAPEAPKTPSGGLLHSVWTLGLLGVIALAGGAFILL